MGLVLAMLTEKELGDVVGKLLDMGSAIYCMKLANVILNFNKNSYVISHI
jgi:hypothetical protein